MAKKKLPIQMVVRNIDGVLQNGLDLLLSDGNETVSRVGDTKEVIGARFVITNPNERSITNPFRKHSYIAQLAETLWVLAGSNDITWLSKFLPRAPDFSDDGTTWRAAYGDRIRKWPMSLAEHCEARNNGNTIGLSSDSDEQYIDQLLAVVSELKKSGHTRQAVIAIWDPARELSSIGNTKDMPCFVAGTKIWTNRGAVPIEDVVVGDKVVSFNKSTLETELKTVTFSGKTSEVSRIIRITTDLGDVIECTPEHIFYVKDYEFVGQARQPFTVDEVSAENLNSGDYLLRTPVYKDGAVRYKKNLRKNTSIDNMVSFHGELLGEHEGVCHHLDGDFTNNSDGNLELLGNSEHNSLHKTESNSASNELTSNRRKLTASLYEGITRGDYHDEWDRELVLSEVYKALECGALRSLHYDIYQKEACYLGLPSIQYLTRRSSWGFRSYADFIAAMNEKFDDLSTIHKSRKKPPQFSGYGRVTSVEVLEKVNEPVYDITVEDNHNFMLENGYFVHNCNDLIQFIVRDNLLHIHVYVRSNDLIWGLSGINYFEFSVLQELVASWLGVGIGFYIHSAMSLHMYSRHYESGGKMLEWYSKQSGEVAHDPLPISNGDMPSDLRVISELFKLIGKADNSDEDMSKLINFADVEEYGLSSRLIDFFNPLIRHVIGSL